jgi:hypothetical protein
MSTITCSTCSFIPKLPINNGLIEEGLDWSESQNLKALEKNFPIREVRFGDAVYPFINVVYGHYEPTVGDSVFQAYIAEVFMPIIGRGQSFREAKQDWERQFHTRFHELYVKCWWERSEEERRDWKIFEEVVDMVAFRKATPLEFTETGKILSIGRIEDDKLFGFEIEWLDGQSEILNCAVTPEFTIDFVLGGYYEMKLLRDYLSGDIVKIRDAIPVDYKEDTKEEIDAWLKSQLDAKNITGTAWVTLTVQK